jgi:CRISPR type IV-associated protein Csf3
MAMVPLRVTFDLSTHVSLTDVPLHLDGVLAWAAVEIATRDGVLDLDHAAAKLPLARKGDPEVWCASAIEFDFLDVPNLRLMTRTTNVEAYAEAIDNGQIKLSRERQNLPTDSGPLRNFMLTVPTRPCKTAHAWCIGDAGEIGKLLKEIKFLGKYGRMGFGCIEKITVEPDNKAKTAWKRRHLPWAEPGYLPVTGNFQAPYWNKSTMTKVYVPPTLAA